jgi:GMP synthase-like glutamine amidotransferase
MKIAIFNLSTRHESLDQHGDAPQLIEKWLSPAISEAVFTGINIATGENLPELSSFDGYILSGSEKGVYDDSDWKQPLVDFLCQLRAAEIPVFGICFGHQLMAEAYGGKAIKADKGFVVGVQEYEGLGNVYPAHAMHRDQVVEVPDSATVTASASYCPVAALNYDFPACSVQFHPEFQQQLVHDAIDDFEGSLLDSSEAAESRISMLDNSVEISLLAQEIAAFFKSANQAKESL